MPEGSPVAKKQTLLQQKIVPGEKKYFVEKFMMIIVMPWAGWQVTVDYLEILKA